VSVLGRHAECAALDRLLQRVRAGQSSVLVLRGEAGIGKTALLEFLAARATRCRVARAVGVQAEMELPFAGLHRLCAPVLDAMPVLPAPQREALRAAFGLAAAAAPDRFLVALAVLTLLAATAGDQPLLCVIDDAQWLDRASAQALAFVARRLLADPIAMVFAVREPPIDELAGLPELLVQGLAPADARALLASVMPGRMDARLRDRVLAEARGNPLALLELPRRWTPAELASGFGRPRTGVLATRLEHTFRERVQALPRDTQRLLLAAAAEPLGDSGLLWRAAERLGIASDAGGPAEAAELIELGPPVRFKHPLVRSAVYWAADLSDRREVHRALGEATDPIVDPDRRAWHRAHAAAGLDEEVAGELERSAGRAQARGGAAATAAFLQRATELTPDRRRRAARALAAARAQFEAAAPETAYELLAAAEMGPLDALQRAQAERLRAELAFARRQGSDAPPLLLRAARRLEPLDAELARDTYLDALSAALYVGRMAGHAGVLDVAERARAALDATRSRRTPDLLLDGLAVLVTEGYSTGAPLVRRALAAFSAGGCDDEDAQRWLWLAIRTAGYVWDDLAWDVLTTRYLEYARDAGALTELPVALAYRAGFQVHAGELDAASALLDEASVLAQAASSAPLMYASLMLAAWQGREDSVSELIGAAVAERAPTDEGRPLAAAEWMRAVLCNGLGRYEDALSASERATGAAHELGPSLWALPELIEAAARTSSTDRAGEALQRLAETARASGGDWGLGLEARSRALLTDGERAEEHYREAINRLARTRLLVHLARAQLVYGEWLRRKQRRADARDQLRAAHERFSRIGAQAFAARAGRELVAAGETMRRVARPLDALTRQELQVARLARDGHTNPEIGARLFISPRTAEYHLRKVFRKLGVTSRNELRDALVEQFA
jgi:DNA-binding CsgD family transcriptional regulator